LSFKFTRSIAPPEAWPFSQASGIALVGKSIFNGKVDSHHPVKGLGSFISFKTLKDGYQPDEYFDKSSIACRLKLSRPRVGGDKRDGADSSP
jgi:hypothetical protein